MSRWLKILLLALVITGAGLVSLPWWLGAALRPVLKAQGVTFGRYERAGYAHFRLHDVRFAHAGFTLTVGQVQSLNPLAWLVQRLRGAEPALLVVDWQVERSSGTEPAPTEKPPTGLSDLQAELRRLDPRVGTWLPRAHLSTGVVRGFGLSIRIIVLAELPKAEHNAMLHLFSAREELLRYGQEHYRPHSQETSSLLFQLFTAYSEGPKMSDKLQEFVRETMDMMRAQMTIEERLKGLSAEERLKGLPAEERLKGLTADEVLRALSPETREAVARQLKANGPIEGTPPASERG